MPFIFNISLRLHNELDGPTEFFGSPTPAQRCCGCFQCCKETFK